MDERQIGQPDEGEDGYGWYLYGLLGAGPLAGFPTEGMDPAYLAHALPHQGLQALVSRVELAEFGPEQLRANLDNLAWVAEKVLAHQRVLQTALASGAVVPLKFCTIYRSESCLREALAAHYDDLLRDLARLEGKGEWGVKVFCDGATLTAQAGEASERVRQLETEAAGKSEGAAYFVRKKLEQARGEEAERLSDACAQASHDRLAAHAADAVLNALHSREMTGREDQMILNGAYLVAEERLPSFRAELDSLGEEYGRLGFSYELTGRWPAYNFVTIGVEEAVRADSVTP
jgi:hypothetical protein